MSASAMFVSEEKRAVVRGWYERFRAKLAVPVEARTVATSFGHTHALVAGPKGAPPLVVLHGALASSAHVLPEIGSLVETRRVVALDVIGQSVMSEDRRVDLGGDAYGRWVVEATEALGVPEFDLLGVSWGGFVARGAASFAPERVRRLALVVPAGFVAGPFWAGLRDAGWPLMMYRAFPSRERLLRFVNGQCTTADDTWTDYFGDALLAYRLDMRIPPLAKAGELDALTCPTLVFGADADVSFPGPALLARVRELVPHAEVEMLEACKHCPPFTDAFRATLAKRVDRFLLGEHEAKRPEKRRAGVGGSPGLSS